MLSPTTARGRLLKGDGVRFRPSYVLIFVVLITLVAGWIDLPGDTLDVFGIKEDVDVSQGLDLQGGVQVLLKANPPEGQEVDSDTLKGTRDTIERRVNGLGVSEPLIQTRGNNQIIVELPGVEDPQAAVEVVQQTALLEIIDPQGQTLPVGAIVETNLGGQDSVVAGADPDASPVGSPLASPVDPAAGSPAAGSPIASPVGSPEASPVAEVVVTPETTPETTEQVYTTIVSGRTWTTPTSSSTRSTGRSSSSS